MDIDRRAGADSNAQRSCRVANRLLRDSLVDRLARNFVDELLRECARPLDPSIRVELVARLTAALQQAIEPELDLIRRDLEPWR